MFKTKSGLNTHIKTAKYCLKLRDINLTELKCDSCRKTFSTLTNLNRHQKSCKIGDFISDKIESIEKYKHCIGVYEEKISFLQEELKKKELTIQQLQKQMQEVALKAVSRDFEDETTIEIDDTQISDSDYGDDSDSDDEDQNDYQLTPLEVGQGYTIEHRDEDWYINVTNLCKAGGKLFKNWKKTQKTKAFLSSTVPIRTVELIKQNTGGNGERHTWVHPQVAINIAQWISPAFDVKVSGWVYEIMMTGKVDITTTKTYKELQRENKNKELKIQYLTKKYVKAQPRVQYEERNVVYILTTKRMKKDRVYILGKATNLTSRLSTYNKSDEHEVVYYQCCGDEETMALVENMVFMFLKDYREQANRERFILPVEEEITLFSDVIKKSVEFFKK